MSLTCRWQATTLLLSPARELGMLFILLLISDLVATRKEAILLKSFVLHMSFLEYVLFP